MRALVVLLLAAACSAPPLPADLAAAQRLERQGKVEAALAEYARAQQTCKTIRIDHVRRQTCAQAHTGYAELLEDQNRRAEAADAYEAMPAVLNHDPVPSAKALYRAGRLRLALGQDKRAYTLLWKAVTEYPDVAYAVNALRELFNDGRRRNPGELYQVLSGLVDPLAGNDVSDNILFDMAVIAEKDFGDLPRAREHLDTIIADYRDGGMFDNACWQAARISRALGDGKGAVARLRTLLATREVAVGAGSYFSVLLDDSQLELGRVLRDDLHEYKKAAAAFRRLPKDYPASLLRDDALFEEAVTWGQAGDGERACRVLAALHGDWPDSKYELEKAPALRSKLSCPAVAKAEAK